MPVLKSMLSNDPVGVDGGVDRGVGEEPRYIAALEVSIESPASVSDSMSSSNCLGTKREEHP